MGFFNMRMCSLIVGWFQVVSYAILFIWFLVHICVYNHEHPDVEDVTTTMPTLVNGPDEQVVHHTAVESHLVPIENSKLEKTVKSELALQLPPHMIKEGIVDKVSPGSETLEKEGELHQPASDTSEHHNEEVEKSVEHLDKDKPKSSETENSELMDKEEKEHENENADESQSISTTMAPTDEMMEPSSLASLITFFVWTLLFLAFSILLVLGILQERPKLMLPYIVLNFISIGIGLLFLLIMFIQGMISDEGFGKLMVSIAYEFVSVGLLIVFIIPVYIQYKRMRLYFDRTERHSLRDTSTAPKTNYVHGDDV